MWCLIKMRAAFLALILPWVMEEGESKKAALILIGHYGSLQRFVIAVVVMPASTNQKGLLGAYICKYRVWPNLTISPFWFSEFRSFPNLAPEFSNSTNLAPEFNSASTSTFFLKAVRLWERGDGQFVKGIRSKKSCGEGSSSHSGFSGILNNWVSLQTARSLVDWRCLPLWKLGKRWASLGFSSWGGQSDQKRLKSVNAMGLLCRRQRRSVHHCPWSMTFEVCLLP